MIEQYEAINKWLAEEINFINKSSKKGKFIYQPNKVHDDVGNLQKTSQLIIHCLSHYSSACTHLALQDRIDIEPQDFDGFFSRMHLVGHLILKKLYPDSSFHEMESFVEDDKGLAEVALFEMAALFLAIFLTKRYTSLEHITEFMSQCLIQSLRDVETLKNDGVVTKTTSEVSELTYKLFAVAIQAEKALQH